MEREVARTDARWRSDKYKTIERKVSDIIDKLNKDSILLKQAMDIKQELEEFKKYVTNKLEQQNNNMVREIEKINKKLSQKKK